MTLSYKQRQSQGFHGEGGLWVGSGERRRKPVTPIQNGVRGISHEKFQNLILTSVTFSAF